MAKNEKEFAPARSAKEKLNQLINLSFDAAETKLRDGTASSQLICLLLQCASEKQNLEIEKLKSDIDVANARVKQLDIEAANAEGYNEAIKAIREYQGYSADDELDEEDDYDD